VDLFDQTLSEEPSKFSYPFVFFHNINGLSSKFTEFYQLTYSIWPNISILNLQETKLKESTSDSTVELNDFHLFRLDRDLTNFEETRGGGLIMYINKKWCHNKSKLLFTISNCDAEIISIVCRQKHLPNIYTCIINLNIYFRPQRNKINCENIIRNHLQNIFKKYSKAYIIITGDANHKCIKAAKYFSLENKITSPTYYPTLTQLDVAYVTNSQHFECKIHSPIGNCETSYHISYFLIPTRNCRHKVINHTKTNTINKSGVYDSIYNTN